MNKKELKEGYTVDENGVYHNAAGEVVEETEATQEVEVEETELSEKMIKQLADVVEKIVDAKIAKVDVPVRKNINTKVAVKTNADGMPREEKFKIWVKGMVANDMSEWHDLRMKDAMNSTNTSEVIPPSEFVAEVMRLEDQFGVAARYADVRRTDAAEITFVEGNGDVVITKTDESTAIVASKNSYLPLVLPIKQGYKGLAPVNQELLDDSSINLFNDMANRFARAFSKKEDELVFTDATTGIVNAASVNHVTVNGTSFEDLKFDDLSKALFGMLESAAANGRFYLNYQIVGVIARIKDLVGRPILTPGPDGPVSGTIWGRPYTTTLVLPDLTLDAPSTPFVVYGDLQYALLGIRNQMSAKIFDTGTLTDVDQETINLLTQDAQAMRVVRRMNAKVKFGKAFSVISTAAANS